MDQQTTDQTQPPIPADQNTQPQQEGQGDAASNLMSSINDLMASLQQRQNPVYGMWDAVAHTLAAQRGLIPALSDHDSSPEHAATCATHTLAAEFQKHADATTAGTTCTCHFCISTKPGWTPEACCGFCKVVISQTAADIAKQEERLTHMKATKDQHVLDLVAKYAPGDLPPSMEEAVTAVGAHYRQEILEQKVAEAANKDESQPTG